MNKTEFVETMQPAIRLFGDPGADRLDIYFDVLRSRDRRIFALAVERVIRSHAYKSMPMPAVFIEEVREVERQRAEFQRPAEQENRCHVCGGTTWVDGGKLVRDGITYDMAVPCGACPGGMAKRKFWREEQLP